jgi:glycolate oxidase iron-sulfur subunit
MQTRLAPEYPHTPEGQAAEAILRKCVHCGFCTATCPTYQLLGDELDGPRGRIYLMKQVLEGHTPTRKTQLHLDRCLTCRNCESTCPSGVDYAHLLDIGRKLVDAKVPRPAGERAVRWALKEGFPRPCLPRRFGAGPSTAAAAARQPAKQGAAHKRGAWPTRTHARKVLLLAGCVQPAMAPNINSATARVLDAVGIQTVVAPKAGCCGAVKFHLNDQEGGKARCAPTSTPGGPTCKGCGVTVKEYAHFLHDDPQYAEKAAHISGLTKDLSEWLPELAVKLKDRVTPSIAGKAGKVAFHPPCSLQHGQQLRGGVEKHLGELGFDVRLTACEPHLCCGSAGTYSVLNPALAGQLRDRKLGHLLETFDGQEPTQIASANIGCITHLQSGTSTPVRHWVEVLDATLTGAP